MALFIIILRSLSFQQVQLPGRSCQTLEMCPLWATLRWCRHQEQSYASGPTKPPGSACSLPQGRGLSASDPTEGQQGWPAARPTAGG